MLNRMYLILFNIYSDLFIITVGKQWANYTEIMIIKIVTVCELCKLLWELIMDNKSINSVDVWCLKCNDRSITTCIFLDV